MTIEGFFSDTELRLIESDAKAWRDAVNRQHCGVHESTLGLLARCALQVDLLTREVNALQRKVWELEREREAVGP